jgi:acetate kinase
MSRTEHAILTLNAGSSSLRFAVFDADCARPVEGKFEHIGRPDACLTVNGAGARALELRAHLDCLPLLYELLDRAGINRPAVVAHRVANGGPNHFDATDVTRTLLDELRAISPMAPHHLPAEISLMEEVGRHWPDSRQIACFDTAFHRDLPLPPKPSSLPGGQVETGGRSGGFHGLAFTSVMAELEHRTGRRIPARVVLVHLERGASLAAVRSGRCVDITRDFSALGAADLPGWMIVPASACEIRDLLDREGSDARAPEALAIFVHRVRKAIGACSATLGGLDALVFSGDIGEHSPALRARICAQLEFLDLVLDPALNAADAPVISSAASRITVHVVSADVESALATAART